MICSGGNCPNRNPKIALVLGCLFGGIIKCFPSSNITSNLNPAPYHVARIHPPDLYLSWLFPFPSSNVHCLDQTGTARVKSVTSIDIGLPRTVCDLSRFAEDHAADLLILPPLTCGSLTMFDPSDGPIIPQRTSAKKTLRSKGAEKRHSLPFSSTPVSGRRPSNHIIVKPASTEVISSLIDTLSAISSPTEHHFDSFPTSTPSHSTPVSPRPWRVENPAITQSSIMTDRCAPMKSNTSGLALDDTKHQRPHGVHSNYFLHPDLTSSVSTERSTPQRRSSNTSLLYSPPNATNYFNLCKTYSIGNLSVESRQPAARVKSSTDEATKTVKGVRSFRDLKPKPSSKSLNESDGLHIHKRSSERGKSRGRLFIGDSPPGSPSTDRVTLSKPAARSSMLSEPPNVPYRASSARSITTPRRLYWDSDEVFDMHSVKKEVFKKPSRDSIPTRNSSLRHKSSTLTSQGRRRSQLSESSGNNIKPDISPNEVDSNNLHPELENTSNDPTEDVISRRIKELKDRKLQRDRNSMDTSSNLPSASQTPDRSLSPSPTRVVQHEIKASDSTAKNGRLGVEAEKVRYEADDENSAPSPAIAQRIDRTRGSSPNAPGVKPLVTKHSPPKSPGDSLETDSSPPQRSDSRLLKRFSQPTSPAVAGRHQRTSSNSFNHATRNTSYPTESGDSVADAVDEYIQSPRLSQKIFHSQTGRAITFSEVGDSAGSVVFCCVGMGLTRYITAFYDELASTLKLRLITPDRPGVGGSDAHADGLDTPLGWPDDILAICQHLRITKFSILAHSAGAIYALATALRMPQHIRCRVHLLAPWIPPSQMSAIGAQRDSLPSSAIPFSQRFLRSIPATFLRAANSSFLNPTSDSVTVSLPKSPRRSKRSSSSRNAKQAPENKGPINGTRSDSFPSVNTRSIGINQDSLKENDPPDSQGPDSVNKKPSSPILTEKGARSSYETQLTEGIWGAATTGANPAVDLLVCLERRQPIGFRYVDITRAVVIHHGAKDTRVPVENVKWLGKTMRRCEVRVLEGQGHGLMASAAVMGNVLIEMAQEWAGWNSVVQGNGRVGMGMERRVTNAV